MGLKQLYILLFLIISFAGRSLGQEVKASIDFLGDTTAIGKPVGLRIAVSHPERTPVIFPRKSKYFKPFEFISQKAFPTRTVDGISYDTAIYQLRTFEMNEVQYLKLPFGYVQGKDTLDIYSKVDSIQLNYRYLEGASVEEFRAVGLPIEMTDPPNYTLIILLSLAGIVFLIGLFFVLKEPVIKRLKLRNNKKQFEEALFKLKSISGLIDPERQIEVVNDLWKSYLDPDQEHKLKALTTMELEGELIMMHHLNEEHREPLIEASALYDRAVYAGEYLNSEEINNLLVKLIPAFEVEFLRRKEVISQDR
ncbi:MAG: hypothetical protein MRZ79_02620 [Bacteroidia bacterium]|nr:hypothetical protein [Bacteroidia bacterium]